MEDKMAQQNIYDDEIFFEGYKKIRDNKINANNLFEIPTLFSMLPDLKNKRILDLGCGFGEHCKVSAKYCYITHEVRLHQNDRCKRFTPV